MTILYEKDGHTAIVTLNRPEALNAFSPEAFTEFNKAMTSFHDDPEAWVAIITGAGKKAFSVGADLKTLVPLVQKNLFKVPPTIMRGLSIYKPLIAAVNGIAVGGGFEVALSCDIRIAAENAVFGAPEVKWSLMPGLGGTQRLPRMIPTAKAAELLFTGNTIDAKEALHIGLVSLVVPQDQLMPVAKEWAHRICDNGPLAVWAVKEAMITGADQPLNIGLEIEKSLSDKLLATEDAEEGARAFSEKRKPVYKGR